MLPSQDEQEALRLTNPWVIERGMELEDLGWNPTLQYYFDEASALGDEGGEGEEAEAPIHPARVVRVDRGLYRLLTIAKGNEIELSARQHPGKPLAVAGDWCAVRPIGRGQAGAQEQAQLHSIFPRKTFLSRKAAGRAHLEQPIAANLDLALLVTDTGDDFSPRRIERLLVAAREGAVRPVVVLNKSDLCDDIAPLIREIEAVAPGVQVLAVSAASGEGVSALRDRIGPGETVVLLGSSGVGKSSIVNRLLGAEQMATGAVAADGRGKHTTTHRELTLMPEGGVLMDTPGLREVGLWAGRDALEGTFADITELAGGCRYADCHHQQEPGCAVARAVDEGILPADRLQSYHRLGREMEHAARRSSEHERRAHDKKTWGGISKLAKEQRKLKSGR